MLSAGIYPTVVTPYTCAGIDVPALECQLNYQLDNGVHGLVLLGTIGEGHVLNNQERADVIATAVRVAGGRVPVVVGIHTCNVDVALAQIQQARELGATAVLVKYHGNRRASDAQVLAFYTALSDANILPIIIYHYPSDTGLSLSHETIAALLRLANVLGIKESTLNLREMAGHMKMVHGQGKLFFSATALNLTQFLDMGGHGFMCPEAVILPKRTVACYEAMRIGHRERARYHQGELFALVPLYRRHLTAPILTRAVLMSAFDLHLPLPVGIDPPAVRLKEALAYVNVPTPTFSRQPTPALTPLDVRQVQRTMAHVVPLAP